MKADTTNQGTARTATKTGLRAAVAHANGKRGNGMLKPIARGPLAAQAAHAPAKPTRPKKVKMVRESLVMPRTEYAALAAMKLRAGELASPIKKKKLIRAAIAALAAMPDKSFLNAIRSYCSHDSQEAGRASKVV